MPLRAHLTLVATAIVAASLLITAGLLILAINSVLVHAADSATASRAAQLSAAVHQEGPAGVDGELLKQADNIDIIQVLDSDGRVVIAVPPTRIHALTSPVNPEGRHSIYVDERYDDDSEYRATVHGVIGPGHQRFTVIVGAAERPIQRTVALTALMCAIGFPVMVTGMAVLTYLLTGRTLRSVDDIRAHMAAAADQGLPHPLIPVPTAGDETSALANTMNAMIARINSAHRQETHFIASAAHDLTDPVAVIVDTLGDAIDRHQEIHPATDKVLAPEVTRMRTIVAELLRSARSGAQISTVSESGLASSPPPPPASPRLITPPRPR